MTTVFNDKSLSHLRSAHRTAKPGAARRRASLGAIALVAIALAAVIASPAAAQPDPGLVARLDSVAGSLVAEKRAVGTVAAVVQGNDTLLFAAYGKADVEWDVPMSLDAVFEIGSATKQFTAVALLKLRDQGVLRLDDEITRWLPDFDTRGNTVTLRQLLGHTSGLPDFTEMPEFRGLITNRVLPRDTAYELLQSHPFLFKPGEMQIYNNSGLWLLGLVIEKASGQSYEDYIEKEIFEPLGMERSMYCKSEENIARRAHGYFVLPPKSETSRAFSVVHTWAFAAGALCSSAGDLVTWLRALHGGGVLSPESYAELITPAKLNDGTPLRYSMGMQVGPDTSGLHYIGHGGAGPGFRAEVGWYPEGQLAVVVLINTAGPIDAGEVASELAREVLPWTPRGPLRFVGDPAPLVGRYVGPGREPGEIIEIEVTETPEGVAFSPKGSPPQAFPWVEGLTFGSGQMRLIFRRANGDSGPVTELRRSMPGAHFIFKKIFKKQ